MPSSIDASARADELSDEAQASVSGWSKLVLWAKTSTTPNSETTVINLSTNSEETFRPTNFSSQLRHRQKRLRERGVSLAIEFIAAIKLKIQHPLSSGSGHLSKFIDISPLKILGDYRPFAFSAARLVFRFDDDVYRRAVADVSVDEIERDGRLYLPRRIRSDGMPGVCRRRVGRRARQTQNAAPDRSRANNSNRNFVNKLAAAESANLDFVCRRRYARRICRDSASGVEIVYPKIIPNDFMSAVMALNSVRYSFGAIVSPAIAGIIATQFSASIAYTIDLFTFIASLIAVFLIKAVPSPVNADRPSWQSIKKGWKYALSRQDLLGTYLIDIAAMFFAMPQALYPALAVIYGEKYVGFFPAALAGAHYWRV